MVWRAAIVTFVPQPVVVGLDDFLEMFQPVALGVLGYALKV